MASLPGLPAEVQKSIITSLDYASLCQLRSTSRYFYNFLTESEIHGVFMNTEIEQGEYSVTGRDGRKCRNCARFCDGTEAQYHLGKEVDKQLSKDIAATDAPVVAARNTVIAARAAVRKAKAAVRKVKGQKQKVKKQVLVGQAQQDLNDARNGVKISQENAAKVRIAIHAASVENMDNSIGKRCRSCKRITNGHLRPGVLELSALTKATSYYGRMDEICTRTKHYNRRLSFQDNLVNAQIDGKICKTCWKGTGRGASGKQRRKAFAEDYGYWMRQTWLAEAKEIKLQALHIASKTFEQIEKDKEEADAARDLEEIHKIKEEAATEEN